MQKISDWGVTKKEVAWDDLEEKYNLKELMYSEDTIKDFRIAMHALWDLNRRNYLAVRQLLKVKKEEKARKAHCDSEQKSIPIQTGKIEKNIEMLKTPRIQSWLKRKGDSLFLRDLQERLDDTLEYRQLAYDRFCNPQGSNVSEELEQLTQKMQEMTSRQSRRKQFESRQNLRDIRDRSLSPPASLQSRDRSRSRDVENYYRELAEKQTRKSREMI